MTNISKFVKDHPILCVGTLGIAVLGYLGCHGIKWVINKCHATKKIDIVAQKVIGAPPEKKVSPGKIESTNSETLPSGEVNSSKQNELLNAISVNTTTHETYPKHIADVALERLKIEKSQKKESSVIVNNSYTNTDPNNRVQPELILEPPIEQFTKYKLDLRFPDLHRQSFDIHRATDVETFINAITENINSNHMAMEMSFDRSTNDKEVLKKMEGFQKLDSAQSLQFHIHPNDSRAIIVQPKPIKSEAMGEGKIRHIYANGTTEEFSLNDLYDEGTRLFPDGKKEIGSFHKEMGNLLSGYRMTTDGKIAFTNPNSFASYKKESETSKFEVCEVEGKLVVLKKTQGKNYQNEYVMTDIPVDTILLQSTQRQPFSEGQSIKNVLLHKSFAENQKSFIEHMLAPNELGIPRLFGLSNAAALDVIEIGSKITHVSPLQIIDPTSGRNLFMEAAHLGSNALLNKLVELFPQEFLLMGQSIIGELLTEGHSIHAIENIADKIRKLGGELDLQHTLWIQVAQAIEPDSSFEEAFNSLSIDQKRKLYDSAFTYNNPFIHEPSDPPITADQYSINLMWINKSKMPSTQEFLFGNEPTFKKNFIKPVAEWAKANPGSAINIWVDSEMANPEAIERSKALLDSSLEGTSHGTIQFRDVRSMDVVRSNPEAFSEKIPVYFRVDLLRAIAADDTLKKKEKKFFVYGDIDMKPLSAKELFDKKTVNFLTDMGFVMAKGGWLGFENGFQILNGDNAQLMDSHRKIIIDLSVKMALKKPKEIQEQQIYDTYPAMITHFLGADGRYGKLTLPTKGTNAEDPSAMLERFSFDNFKTSAHSNLPLEKGDVKIREIMPRKPVSLPPSHF